MFRYEQLILFSALMLSEQNLSHINGSQKCFSWETPLTEQIQ